MRAGMSVHGGCGRSPYVNWEIKNERMKRYIFCISLCLGVVSGGRAAAQEPPAEPEAALPLLEVKTNALYWTTASLNAGFEVGLTPRITFEIDAGYNPWTFSDNRKFKFWMIQPEIRHWFRNRFEGHFLGVHLLYADFNVGGMKFLGMSDRRYQGALYGRVWHTGTDGPSEKIGASRLRQLWAIFVRITTATFGRNADVTSVGGIRTTSDRRR